MAVIAQLSAPQLSGGQKSRALGRERSAAQLLAASGYIAIARFDPASVGDLPEPKLPYLKAARAYAQGEAAAWQGDAAGIEAAIAAIPEAIADKPDDEAKNLLLAVGEHPLIVGSARWPGG